MALLRDSRVRRVGLRRLAICTVVVLVATFGLVSHAEGVDEIAGSETSPGRSPLFRSLDSGRHWTRLSTGLDERAVGNLAIDRNSPGTVYASSNDLGVVRMVRSTDMGETWKVLAPTFTFANIFDIEIVSTSPPTLVVATFGVARSTDGGASWTVGNAFMGQVDDVAIDPSDPSIVFAVSFDGIIYRSIDGGRTFVENYTFPGPALQSVAVSPVSSDIVYVAGSMGTFVSRNGGRTWNPTGIDTRAGDVACVVPDVATQDSVVFGCYFGGIYRSDDAGARSTQVFAVHPVGHAAASVYDVVQNAGKPREYFASCYGVGVVRSRDRGQTWTVFRRGLGNREIISVAVDPNIPGLVYAGGITFD